MSATTEKLLAEATVALEKVVKAESKSGMRATLSGINVSPPHGMRAMALGQSVDSLLAQARRQILELGTTIRIIAATMPPGDVNAEIISQLGEQTS